LKTGNTAVSVFISTGRSVRQSARIVISTVTLSATLTNRVGATPNIARSAFDRVSFDLIYARQDQDRQAWQRELDQALAMAIDHLSLYQLTIEQGTAFGDRYKIGKLGGLPDEDLAADLYDITQETCDRHGFPAYEVSNHAKWSYGDYVGIGPGAHGRVTLNGTKYATVAPLAPAAWLKQVETQGNGELERNVLTPDDCLTEFLVMGLRVTDGVSTDRLLRLSNGRYGLRSRSSS